MTFMFMGDHGIMVQAWDRDSLSSDERIGEGFIAVTE